MGEIMTEAGNWGVRELFMLMAGLHPSRDGRSTHVPVTRHMATTIINKHATLFV